MTGATTGTEAMHHLQAMTVSPVGVIHSLFKDIEGMPIQPGGA
jgi:hypothetical protein